MLACDCWASLCGAVRRGGARLVIAALLVVVAALAVEQSLAWAQRPVDMGQDRPMPAKVEAASKGTSPAVANATTSATSSAATQAAEPVGPPLQYDFRPGQRYVYEVEISVDLGDQTFAVTGHSHYTVKRVDDDEIVLAHDGTLVAQRQPQQGASRFDPRYREALSKFPASFGGAGEITISRTGQILKNSSQAQLPFLLGPLSTLAIEPLSPRNQAQWETSSQLSVKGKRTQPAPAAARTTSRPRTRLGRLADRSRQTSFVSSGKEEALYTRGATKGELVKIKKHLELQSPGDGSGVPAMDKVSDGDLTFDLKSGVLKKSLYKETIKVNQSQAPLTVSCRLLSDAEVAELDQIAARHKAENEARLAEQNRPLDDEYVRQLLQELKMPNKARAAADRLAQGPVNDQQAAVSEALAALLATSDDITRCSAARALARWGISDSVPALIQALQSDNGFLKSDVLQTLAVLKDDRAAEAVAKQLPLEPQQASRTLIEIGPAVEPFVIPLLSDRDESVRQEACKILARIGTPKSKTALEPLSQGRGDAAREAKKAMRQIETRF